MISYDSIFLFIFVFSLLIVLRTLGRFIGALLKNPPSQLIMTGRELITLGLSISYIITYLIRS